MWTASIDSKATPKVNLKKYTKVDGKRRFVPVLIQNADLHWALSRLPAPN